MCMLCDLRSSGPFLEQKFNMAVKWLTLVCLFVYSSSIRIFNVKKSS